MGELLERVKLNNLIYGNGIAENYKNNSLYFYEKYSKSDKFATSIRIGEVRKGEFYFFHYADDSNWMKYSPVFVTDFKKFGNKIIILALNFNFIPLELRIFIFDKFMTDKNFQDDVPLVVDYEGMYNELKKWGFEYSICEYNTKQVVSTHRIKTEVVPRFLYSGHPINIYDPNKLYSIWEVKIKNQSSRDSEIMRANIKDFYDISNEINESYQQLRGHIERLRKSLEKWG